MLSMLIVLYVLTCAVFLVSLCNAAARVMPRPNRRGGRLAKWLKFHGGLK